MKWDYSITQEIDNPMDGLFVACEGNYQYGNASLSFYDPQTQVVANQIFQSVNGMKLGDVAQSLTIYDGKCWIVVNHSHVVFAIDANTYREVGRIEGLPSPRYIYFVNDTKAYITQLWDNNIYVINPKTWSITGTITIPNMQAESGSTEQMVGFGQYVYVNCWSYQNRIVRIDTLTDSVVDELIVGVQPKSMALDAYDKLWVATDGGYEGSPYGYEPPRLLRIDAATFRIEREWAFDLGASVAGLCVDGDGECIYWINDGVWRMDAKSQSLPEQPFLESLNTKYYGLTISPVNGDVYVADAIDYQQSGMIYRYDQDGRLIDKFNVGITPGSFAWKINKDAN